MTLGHASMYLSWIIGLAGLQVNVVLEQLTVPAMLATLLVAGYERNML